MVTMHDLLLTTYRFLPGYVWGLLVVAAVGAMLMFSWVRTR